MSGKDQRIENLLRNTAQFSGLDPNYTGFFELFNCGEYFEAHDVLEQLWLKDRNGPNGAFYKGLIQLAGAFVHVKKHRTGPALALLRLASANLGRYPATHERLAISRVQDLIVSWQAKLESAPDGSLQLASITAPKLVLEEGIK